MGSLKLPIFFIGQLLTNIFNYLSNIYRKTYKIFKVV